MKLEEKKITKKLSNYNEIKSFMKRVFPKEELIPMWLIILIANMRKYNFNAYYDGDLFVGVLFTIDTKDTLFVFYIAVNDKIQSKGYGSQLLKNIFDTYKEKSVTLFIETMDNKDADNYEQRLKRLEFYERNGFFHTGIKAGAKTPFVDVLSTDRSFDVANTKRLMKFIPMRIFAPVN